PLLHSTPRRPPGSTPFPYTTLFRSCAAAITRLPYRWQISIGKYFGLLLHKIARSRRHVAEVNIGLCFPEQSPAEQAQLVRQIFIEIGRASCRERVWRSGGALS